MLVYFKRNLGLALEGINQNKLRALLTALGIIFGVFAVVAMLAIGNGAKQSIMDQLKIIGTNNIVISAVPPTEKGEEPTENDQKKEGKKKYSPGLNMDDLASISALVPGIEALSVEASVEAKLLYEKNTMNSKCLGVNNDFFEVYNLNLKEGAYFNKLHADNGVNVCIIGSNVASKLFLGKNPIGKYIKAKNIAFKVIGVLEKRVISKENLSKLDINNHSNMIFIPIETFKMRIDNKQRISSGDLKRNSRQSTQVTNYHQLDKMVVKVQEAKDVQPVTDLVSRILTRRHNDQVDFEVKVPELLIKQQQNTQETLNFILAVIAGISLLVGGIGIMNIMLASVLERIKEIGLRRSIGATEKDIVYQFLLEAVAISLAGGIIGVFLGVFGAKIIAQYADITTKISMSSILLSFGIAVSIGIIFGIMPARKAAKLDPISALRTE